MGSRENGSRDESGLARKTDAPWDRENIYGADDRIQELLRKIDWKQVNGALTL
jgi:hypothetical protein